MPLDLLDAMARFEELLDAQTAAVVATETHRTLNAAHQAAHRQFLAARDSADAAQRHLSLSVDKLSKLADAFGKDARAGSPDALETAVFRFRGTLWAVRPAYGPAALRIVPVSVIPLDDVPIETPEEISDAVRTD